MVSENQRNEITAQVLLALRERFESEDEFITLYTTPRGDEPYPESMTDSEHQLADIRDMFLRFYETIADTLQANLTLPRFSMQVFVTPYALDETKCAVVYHSTVIARHTRKAKNFVFNSVEDLKNEVFDVYCNLHERVTGLLGDSMA